MPLTTSGFVSRYDLDHPDEKPVVKPTFERVLKYNPNHGPDGRFASSGGGRRGGTVGAPTEDAFGRPLAKGKVKKPIHEAGSGLQTRGSLGKSSPPKSFAQQARDTAAAHEKAFGASAPKTPIAEIRAKEKALEARWDADGRPAASAKTLEYRPDRDKAQGQHKTLEYRSERDKAQGETQQVRYNVHVEPRSSFAGGAHMLGPLPKTHPGSMKGGTPTKRSSFS